MRLKLEQALASYQSSVYKAAFYICRNREDAEDAAQDTFLAYHREPREFESEEHIRAWLLRTAMNKARNIVASFWRRNRVDLPDFTAWAGELPDSSWGYAGAAGIGGPGGYGNAAGIGGSGEYDGPNPAALIRAVMALPEKCRITVHLFYYEDYSVKQIAEIMQVSENTVKSQLNRGRRLLKERLGEEWKND